MTSIRDSLFLVVGLVGCLSLILLLTGCSQPINKIDHIIWAVPDLEAGAQMFERLSGVKPIYGGAHPGRGTRNNLVSAGEDCYFEIIAPDPAQAPIRVSAPM